MNFSEIKKLFPFFSFNPNTVYLDNAATSLKPLDVVNAVNDYNTKLTVNIYRGESKITDNLLNIYWDTKAKLGAFFKIKNIRQIVFTSGTTMALNTAYHLIEPLLDENDVILTTYYEHSSNLMPLLQLAKKTKAKVQFLDIDFKNIDLDDILKQIKKTKNLKVLSLIHHSNIFGFSLPIEEIGHALKEDIKKKNLIFIVDGAQGCLYNDLDIEKANISFFACSAHKMYAPTGIGMLYQSEDFNHLTPVFGGGNSVLAVEDDLEIVYKQMPLCLEPGTLNLSGICGWNKALDFINKVGKKHLQDHEIELSKYAIQQLKLIDNIVIYNQSINAGIILFNIKGFFCQDVASYLMSHKIITRAGDHCVKLLRCLILEPKAVRISFAVYNIKEDIDILIKMLKQGIKDDFILI
ncbi:aminotransferase class V-fold PLP-dependent enzyme [Mycoplasma sp. SG1]|uniref:aminotransferase class V-fold PLP-dependent enzyme n=1 Tax=Mycoplasma sp. SG1 TaxID=2810348 RepID=UPI002023F208|nr:aminotransferase class V-fold PLP-dependent enzyme [Mycoplasma sp. SG1]URM52748.1 aminotransferase class V-fold PLP-dependent enzyme [Mycoplasma sp. SG1]